MPGAAGRLAADLADVVGHRLDGGGQSGRRRGRAGTAAAAGPASTAPDTSRAATPVTAVSRRGRDRGIVTILRIGPRAVDWPRAVSRHAPARRPRFLTQISHDLSGRRIIPPNLRRPWARLGDTVSGYPAAECTAGGHPNDRRVLMFDVCSNAQPHPTPSPAPHHHRPRHRAGQRPRGRDGLLRHAAGDRPGHRGAQRRHRRAAGRRAGHPPAGRAPLPARRPRRRRGGRSRGPGHAGRHPRHHGRAGRDAGVRPREP